MRLFLAIALAVGLFVAAGCCDTCDVCPAPVCNPCPAPACSPCGF